MRAIGELVRETGLYRRALGNPRGIPLGLLAGVRRLEGRTVELRSRELCAPAEVRIGSSDFQVFYQVFVAMEYDLPLATAPSTIVDGGANIGLTAIWMATRFPEARIIAVEPDPENFRLLVRNTTHYPRIQCLRAALWSESGSVTLQDPGAGSASFRVARSASAQRGTSVPAITLRELFDRFDLDRVDLLKLDVEGAEVALFSDAGAWIDDVQAIAIELHDRFQPGASASFYRATASFRSECSRGELSFVQRVGTTEVSRA